jgi:hypothetical protein
MLRRGALIVLVAALAGAAMFATVPAATATTEPAVTFFVLVRVTDSQIVLSCPACPGHHQFRRGWAAHFDVVNRGTKPYKVDIGGLRTRDLRPGQKQRVSAYFDNRGRFQFKVVGSAVPRHKGWLRVI